MVVFCGIVFVYYRKFKNLPRLLGAICTGISFFLIGVAFLLHGEISNDLKGWLIILGFGFSAFLIGLFSTYWVPWLQGKTYEELIEERLRKNELIRQQNESRKKKNGVTS